MKTVFFDVDTQNDFLFPGGALYVPGAENIVDTIAALNHFAAVHNIPVVSTVDAHTPDDPEFQTWPPHCVAGTAGQEKPASTLLDKRIVVPTGACELALDGAQQIVIEKQTFDCFSNINLPRVLLELAADRYIVYGVVTEICVQFATNGLLENALLENALLENALLGNALLGNGLLKTGKRVELVTDAVRSINHAAAREMQSRLRARDGILTDAATVMSAPMADV